LDQSPSKKMQNLEEKNKTHHKNKHYNKNQRSKFGMRFVYGVTPNQVVTREQKHN
jgi:hypothetical protein